jgi:hypothetical protein
LPPSPGWPPPALCARSLCRKQNVGERAGGALHLCPLLHLPGNGLDLATSRRRRHKRAEDLGLIDFSSMAGGTQGAMQLLKYEAAEFLGDEGLSTDRMYVLRYACGFRGCGAALQLAAMAPQQPARDEARPFSPAQGGEAYRHRDPIVAMMAQTGETAEQRSGHARPGDRPATHRRASQQTPFVVRCRYGWKLCCNRMTPAARPQRRAGNWGIRPSRIARTRAFLAMIGVRSLRCGGR